LPFGSCRRQLGSGTARRTGRCLPARSSCVPTSTSRAPSSTATRSAIRTVGTGAKPSTVIRPSVLTGPRRDRSRRGAA
jgi:hypothetical protein